MPPTANKVYKLINVESTTLLTLDVDLKVNGRHDIDKPNQKWRAYHVSDKRWEFASLYRDPRAPDTPLFLNIDGDIREGTRLVGSSTRFGWDIWENWGSIFAAFAPGGKVMIDLDGGKRDDGTKIALWGQIANNAPKQYWLFQEVKDA